MRGTHISKPMEDLVREAEGLVRKGVKEIMLIAQELTYYGLDMYKKRMLPDLLKRLADIPGLGMDTVTLCLSIRNSHWRYWM